MKIAAGVFGAFMFVTLIELLVVAVRTDPTASKVTTTAAAATATPKGTR
jgi:hypothetical protein